MTGTFDRSATKTAAAALAFAWLAAAPVTGSAAECPLPSGETASVAAVVGGDTIVLEDGTPVRLAAVSVPESAASATFPAQEAAERALATLVAGRLVAIRPTSEGRDRYGRVVAQIFLAEEGGNWIQAELVEAGLAIVQTVGAEAGCARALLAVEAMAREARAGLWADPAFAPVGVDAAALRDVNGGYAIVEGRVVSVGRTERTVYLNFGTDWSTDFTAVIATSVADGLDLGGLAVDALSGRAVRLRGWIEAWDGPSMRLDHGGQIEVLP